MADQRDGGIAWTDETWNPIRGCSRVSEGCRNCYAEGMAARFTGPGMAFEGLAHRVGGEARWTGAVRLIESKLLDPIRWKRPRRVFVNSVSDPFHENVTDEMRDSIFAVMALAPQHTFQVLTKRADRMREYMALADRRGRHPAMTMAALIAATGAWNTPALDLNAWPLTNVWLGVSIENQAAADERIPHLLATPAAVRFLSCEPLLGPVDLDRWLNIVWQCQGCRGYFTGRHREICPDCGREGFWCGSHAFNGRGRKPNRVVPPQSGRGIDWVIAGGESGPKARPMHPDWARSLRDQCAAAGVPFMFKQWGEWSPHTKEIEGPGGIKTTKHPGWRAYSPGSYAGWFHVGKKAAGRLLDGVEHNGFPEAVHGQT